MQITNCHIHTFTQKDVPPRFVWPPLSYLLRIGWVRRSLLAVVRLFDRGKRGRIARLGEILETTHKKSQKEVFGLVRGYYPNGTRFIVLPMDMTQMGRGRPARTIDQQHSELIRLRECYPEAILFAAVDPRRLDVDKTIEFLESHQFRGIKLYPPLGYHPNDPRLEPLYSFAEDRGLAVMTHCSRPAGVQYRGKITTRMRTDPTTGEVLDLGRYELLCRFTDPDSYRPILEAHPRLRICLAHFGGAGDWEQHLNRPWDSGEAFLEPGGFDRVLQWLRIRRPIDPTERSWLAKIAEMLHKDEYENLWTDISYTVFADDEYLYLLKVLLSDERIRRRVLFGSDFYVVANARLEERRRSVRIRAVLGEEVFATIAEANPREYLGEHR